MAILGIDFGKRKIGLSISQGVLAQPFQTIKFKSYQDFTNQLAKIIKDEGVETLVVGIPEKDRIGAKKFGERISRFFKMPVKFIDETMTTFEAGKFKTKRGVDKEDQIAASLILQTYLEEINND